MLYCDRSSQICGTYSLEGLCAIRIAPDLRISPSEGLYSAATSQRCGGSVFNAHKEPGFAAHLPLKPVRLLPQSRICRASAFEAVKGRQFPKCVKIPDQRSLACPIEANSQQMETTSLLLRVQHTLSWNLHDDLWHPPSAPCRGVISSGDRA